jgi:hypothetical protein
MARIQREQVMEGHRANYQTARAAIIAKGSYTVLEWDKIEAIAGTRKTCRDLNGRLTIINATHRD